MPQASLEQVGLAIVKKNWVWYLIMGIILIAFGAIAIGRTCTATKVSMVFIGWLMVVAGVTQIIHTSWKGRGWSGFFFDILTGILYAVVGFMVIANPGSTAVTLTLLIAMFLMFDGIFRIVGAISVQVPNWGFVVLSGVISFALGLLIWRQWPYSGLFAIGLFVGIQMVSNGISTVMLSLAAKSLPDQESPMTDSA